VLHELGVSEEGAESRPMIEALNKIDALTDERRETLEARCATGAERARQYPVSAATGEGVEALLEAIGDILGRASETREVAVPLSDGATIAWLYRHGEVRSRHDDGDLARLTVALDPAASAQLERRLVEQRPVEH